MRAPRCRWRHPLLILSLASASSLTISSSLLGQAHKWRMVTGAVLGLSRLDFGYNGTAFLGGPLLRIERESSVIAFEVNVPLYQYGRTETFDGLGEIES